MILSLLERGESELIMICHICLGIIEHINAPGSHRPGAY